MLHSLIASVQHTAGSAVAPVSPDDRPMYGQTLYLAACTLDLRMGSFRAHIFQDLIDKHYIIALAHGDICGADMLHTRLHSSCVTSETLLGCDCDCLQQLEGALSKIAEVGRGILFYSMQEGRGVGYVAKARDRMLVQASQDQLSTFDAYAAMGLKKDHRHYDNIAQICHLLGIKAAFTVLTNNPEKVEAMRAQGLRIAGTEALEYEPSPFNLAYLASKASGGHALKRPRASKVTRALPPGRVTPFRPHALPAARRFIYSASYFLPVNPEGSQMHWFQVHVYYDIVTSQDFVVLTHGTPKAGDVPVVRIHSESLFSRFPLSSAANRDKMRGSIQHILRHGVGALVLLYNDGRGAGFGAYATDCMLTERGLADSSDEAYRQLGVDYDSRDYTAAMVLLRQHLPGQRVQMVMNSPASLVRKTEVTEALHAHHFEVEKWIFLEEATATTHS
ncbi:GTP cyclohydrolase [Nibricoccus sp. IMCC34717]|uniref:GTP cyclohydrolase n=1 Tax=Nibricoccus sp. IMCC34717 TaxID=3034021 RepID=UPI00384A76A8